MKNHGQLVVTFVLTLAVWSYFAYETPDNRLSAVETLLVAAVCGILTWLASAVWKRATRSRRQPNGQDSA